MLAARRPLNLPSSAESFCCASIADFTASAMPFSPKKPLLQTVSPVFLSRISARASSRPWNLSSALSFSVASSARLTSLDASFRVRTPLSTSDLPAASTFLAASADTDFPAAFSSSTSIWRTRLFASALSAFGASPGAASGPGRTMSWSAAPVFCASVSNTG